MTWLDVTWLSVAAACGTLALIHAHVWLNRRAAAESAAFAILAAGVTAMAVVELQLHRSTTPAEFGRMASWLVWPTWLTVLAIVWTVRNYLRAGRAKLGWAVVVLRTAGLAINAFTSPGIHFTEIRSIEWVSLLGASFPVPLGTANPLLAVHTASLVLLVVFVADAAWELWRRGEQRRATVLGGSLVVLVVGASTTATVMLWGIAKFPLIMAPFFMPIILAMATELSRDLMQAAKVSAALATRDAELQASEFKLTLAADAARAGLWGVDIGSGRFWGTPRTLSIFGLEPGREHHVDEVLQAVHADDRDRVRAAMRAPEGPARPVAEEFKVGQDAATARWYALRGGVHRAAPENVLSRMGVMVDITERKLAEAQVALQQVELEHLSRVSTLSGLSGALAHELNQPLAVIMSNAEAARAMLARPAPDLQEIDAILQDIVEADARAAAVILHLRTMLKRGAPDRLTLSVSDVVQEVLYFMRADLLRRGVQVRVAMPPGLPGIVADRVPLEQVLINLIVNACDAVAANAPDRRGLVFEACHEAGQVRLSLTDPGAGLPEPAERVFEPFYTTKAAGLGLGLTISRSIIVAQGGRLWAEPHADRGATFHLTLPTA